MAHGRPRTRRIEAGFTLVELLIVMIIIAILVLMVSLALNSSKVASRNQAMKSAAASVDQALGSFNRIYPRVGTSDPFWQRSKNKAWSGNTGSPNKGLADETGAWILNEWPSNPYVTGGVVLRRYSSPTSCAAMGVPGEIRACRTAGMMYTVRAFGRNRSGATIEVYRASHGAR